MWRHLLTPASTVRRAIARSLNRLGLAFGEYDEESFIWEERSTDDSAAEEHLDEDGTNSVTSNGPALPIPDQAFAGAEHSDGDT